MRRAAQIAGFGYLAVFVLGAFAFSLEDLIVPGDAAATSIERPEGGKAPKLE